MFCFIYLMYNIYKFAGNQNLIQKIQYWNPKVNPSAGTHYFHQIENA